MAKCGVNSDPTPKGRSTQHYTEPFGNRLVTSGILRRRQETPGIARSPPESSGVGRSRPESVRACLRSVRAKRERKKTLPRLKKIPTPADSGVGIGPSNSRSWIEIVGYAPESTSPTCVTFRTCTSNFCSETAALKKLQNIHILQIC